MRLLILSISFVIILPSLSYAIGVYERHMTNGMLNLKHENYEAAEKEFRAALEKRLDSYEALLYLGIIMRHTGREKEARDFLEKALFLNPGYQKTTLELGIYYFNKSIYHEAMDFFEITVDLGPESEFAEEAMEYMEDIKKKMRERNWDLSISSGVQYDSNVGLSPQNGALQEGMSGKSDQRGVMSLRGVYTFRKTGKTEGTFDYSFYQSLHTRLRDFDVTSQTIKVEASYRLRQTVSLKGLYSFDYVYVGGYKYNYAYTVSPSIVIQKGKGFFTTLDYRYEKSRFMDTHLFRNNSDRTGSNSLVRIIQFIPVGGFIRSNLGYSYDRASKNKDYWNYTGNKGFIAVSVDLPFKATAGIYGEYYSKSYEGINPSGVQREDRIQSYSITLKKRLSDKVDVTVGQIYILNRSNINNYDYRRAVSSVIFSRGF